MPGSFKCVFVHGVLHSFEKHSFMANAYGVCSSSTLPGAFAASGKISELPLEIWQDNVDYLSQTGKRMSEVVKDIIRF